MTQLLSKIDELVKILNEAFSATDKRIFQRRFAERLREMRANGFQPENSINIDKVEVNPQANSVNKIERDYQKFLADKKAAGEKRVPTEEESSTDKLYDEYEAVNPVDAERIQNEFTAKVKDQGANSAKEWMTSELLNKLGRQEDDGMWDEFQQRQENEPNKDMEGHGVSDLDPSQIAGNSDVDPSSSSKRRIKHLLLAFKKFMNAGVPDSKSLINSDKELASFFDHLIASDKIDMDYSDLYEVFPNIHKERYDSGDWTMANARAQKRIAAADIPKLREILSKIMDSGRYKDVGELAESATLIQDIIMETTDSVYIIPAGTKIVIG